MYYQPEVIYREIGAERKNSVLRYIGNRVLTTNKNFLCAVTGKTGDGKSWGTLSMCEQYSKMFDIPFDPRIHVIRTLKQLLELIVNKELEKNIRIGTPISFEEPQAEVSAEDWNTELGKMLSVLLSTFRNQRLVVFFSLPFITMMPKKARMLLHAEFKVMGFDKTTGFTTIKPRFLEYNENYDMFYKKRLKIMYKVVDKRKLIKTKLNKWYLERASDDIIDVYETFKKDMTDRLNKKLYEQALQRDKVEEEESKGQIFNKIKEIYEKEGENYLKMVELYPQMSPSTLESWVLLIKRSLKASDKQKPST